MLDEVFEGPDHEVVDGKLPFFGSLPQLLV